MNETKKAYDLITEGLQLVQEGLRRMPAHHIDPMTRQRGRFRAQEIFGIATEAIEKDRHEDT
ncbi:hypothetical protein [Candidatus Poriferisocius sp.]|uniref:hypothetical protein n=1 Tax=Candidatus Poriferisocius sp. TaxID=3101276 RepID=UPI003B52AE2E